MKQVIFDSLSVKNFLSIGSEPLELSFSNGINLITGENKDNNGKNGIGKSTVVDSIFWCLFGNTIRELKKENIQHNQNKEECCVKLRFRVKTQNEEKQYDIKRILNPAKIEILCNGEDITLSTIPKNDEFIKKLINANEEVFNNAVIMTSNNTIPFMAQKKTEKRKFIEGILQLEVFSQMLLKARSEYNDTKKENDICSNSFINQQRNLETFETQKKEESKIKKEKIENWEYNIELKQELIEACKNKKFPDSKEIDDSINNLENNKLNQLKIYLKKYNSNNNENISQKSKIISEIHHLKKEKQKILDKGNTCPTCNREYCKDDIETVKLRISELDSEIKNQSSILTETEKKKTECENNIKTIEEGIDKVNNKIKELNKLKISIRDNEHTIVQSNADIRRFKENIDQINKEKSLCDSNIEKAKSEIEKLEKELKEIKKNLNILDTVKYILSEEGVKTYIVKKIITMLNNRLNFYLNKLEAPCKCIFDEMFDETIYNQQGKEVSYFNFSGGERKRIDIAILFTFQDVLRFHSGTSFSLNMYDELLDCALDTRGIDKIIEILKEKVEKYNESIYIITHKNSDISNISNVLFLEKINGVTRIKN